MYLQQFGAIGVAAERGVDNQARRDLVPTVDDLCLVAQYFAHDLRDSLRRIPTHRGARACLCWRPDLLTRDRVNRIYGADVPAVEFGVVVEEEIDLGQLLLLDEHRRVGERIELARMVPVAMSEHYAGQLDSFPNAT